MVLGIRHFADPRHLARPLWGAFMPMVAALTIALPLLTSLTAVIAIVLGAVLAASIAMIVRGLRRYSSPAPMPWYLLAGSVVLFTIGIALRELFGTNHYLFDDVFTLSGYAGVFVAALLWLTPRRARDSRGLLLDSGLIGLGALLASWTLLISPLLDQGVRPSALVAACYPVIDALLLTVVVHSVVTSTRAETSLRLLHASLAMILLADLGYNLEAAGTLHVAHRILVVPLLISFLLVGLAALHPTMVTLSQQRRVHPDQSRQRAGVIAAVLVVAALVPTVTSRPGVYDRAVESVLLALLLIGVLLRSERAIVRSARSERRAQYQADHDMLTGLLNRSALLQAPARNHERWAGRTLCLLFIDLDGFKAVNDSYGHAIGDELIANAAARIRRVIRHDDVAARYGGDEFVVLTRADRTDTATLAEKLIAAFGKPFELSVGAVSITASIGIACGAPRSDVRHDDAGPGGAPDERRSDGNHTATPTHGVHIAAPAHGVHTAAVPASGDGAHTPTGTPTETSPRNAPDAGATPDEPAAASPTGKPPKESHTAQEHGHLTPSPAVGPHPSTPRDGAPPEVTVYDLLREADSAMYHAKEYSLGYVFQDEMRPHGHPEARRTWRNDKRGPRQHRETTV